MQLRSEKLKADKKDTNILSGLSLIRAQKLYRIQSVYIEPQSCTEQYIIAGIKYLNTVNADSLLFIVLHSPQH